MLKRKRRREQDLENQEKVLTIEELDRLAPKFQYITIEKPKPVATNGDITIIVDDLCAVCIDEIKDSVRKLPCGHIFHSQCIEQWLTTHHASCPMCKRHLKKIKEKSRLERNQDLWPVFWYH